MSNSSFSVMDEAAKNSDFTIFCDIKDCGSGAKDSDFTRKKLRELFDRVESWLIYIMDFYQYDLKQKYYLVVKNNDSRYHYTYLFDSVNIKNSFWHTYENDAIINHVLGHHLLWYDEYIQMSDNDVERFLQQSRNKNCIKVICITTGAVFDSAADAARHYKIQRGCIGNCCKGKQKTAGRLNGVPLKWMYYDKLIELSNEEQDKLLVQY